MNTDKDKKIFEDKAYTTKKSCDYSTEDLIQDIIEEDGMDYVISRMASDNDCCYDDNYEEVEGGILDDLFECVTKVFRNKTPTKDEVRVEVYDFFGLKE